MTLTSLSDESVTQGAFYVPRFEVRIAGSDVPADVLRDITQVTYRDNVKEIDSFELVVNNWDATTRTFKYVGSETRKSLAGDTAQSRLQRLFEPGGKEVEVRMGYLDRMVLMLTGRFTTMEPNFPAGGASTLNVRGLNVLHKLRRKQYTTAWDHKMPSDIAKEIEKLGDPEQKGHKRFPLPIDVSPEYKNFEHPIEYVAQSNQYDIDFLLNLARQYGYVLYITENPAGGKKGQRLYFGRSQDAPPPAGAAGDGSSAGAVAGPRLVNFRLGFGRGLIDFKPTLTTANQVRSVRVNGWNRKTNQPISEVVSIDDKKLNLNKDLHDLFADRFDPREETVTDEPVFTPAQARERAIAILGDRQKVMVKATGSTVGLPDLRAGRIVRIENIGARFSGPYFVTETTHTIGESGYTTQFSARRELKANDPQPEGA